MLSAAILLGPLEVKIQSRQAIFSIQLNLLWPLKWGQGHQYWTSLQLSLLHLFSRWIPGQTDSLWIYYIILYVGIINVLHKVPLTSYSSTADADNFVNKMSNLDTDWWLLNSLIVFLSYKKTTQVKMVLKFQWNFTKISVIQRNISDILLFDWNFIKFQWYVSEISVKFQLN